jgi:hypothetical protein
VEGGKRRGAREKWIYITAAVRHMCIGLLKRHTGHVRGCPTGWNAGTAKIVDTWPSVFSPLSVKSRGVESRLNRGRRRHTWFTI